MCKEVFDLIRKEEERQRNVVELIASEYLFVSTLPTASKISLLT